MQEIITSNIQANGLQTSNVLLDQKIEGSSYEELYAYFTKDSVHLTRISTRDGNHPYGPISADVMDSLCNMWHAFRAKCQAVDEEEDARVLGVQFEIDTILRGYPDIDVEKKLDSKDRDVWHINCEKVGFQSLHKRSVDELLKAVQRAKERLDNRWAALAEAREIVGMQHGVSIEGIRNPGVSYTHAWWVRAKVGGWTRQSQYASNAIDLLACVKAAEAEVCQQIAKQDAEQAAIEQRAREIEAAVVELELYEIASQTDANAPIKLSSYCQLPDGARTWCLNFAPLGWADMDQGDPILMLMLVKEAEHKNGIAKYSPDC